MFFSLLLFLAKILSLCDKKYWEADLQFDVADSLPIFIVGQDSTEFKKHFHSYFSQWTKKY